MRRSLPFIIIAVLMIASTVTLAYVTHDMKGPAFYLSETVLGLCLILLWLYSVRFVKPLNTIVGNIDLLYKEDFSSRLQPVGQHEADRIIYMFNEMMARLKDEQLHLREQNHFLDLLISSSPSGIIIFGIDGRVRKANPAAVKFMGHTSEKDLIGKRLEDLRGTLAEALAEIAPGNSKTVRLSDSRIYRCTHLRYMDKGLGHPFMMIDHLTDDVVKAEKKAYSKVIRMISHEVNNSIGAVNSILGSLKNESGNNEMNEAIDVCISRCITMSRFITSFADVVKIPEAVTVKTDLNLFIRESLSLLESMCVARDIRLVWRPAGRTVTAMIDTVLMEQVLINLVQNSVESIGNGGEVTISVEESPPGFTVADNGKGIDKETQQNLFIPFFSTKADSRGLGLMLVSDVLHKHHCNFSLRTDSDGLTRFSVSF